MNTRLIAVFDSSRVFLDLDERDYAVPGEFIVEYKRVVVGEVTRKDDIYALFVRTASMHMHGLWPFSVAIT